MNPQPQNPWIHGIPILRYTKTLLDVEDAFDISIDEDESVELYDMILDQEVKQIMELMPQNQ